MAIHAVLFDFFGTLTKAVTAPTAVAPAARALGCDDAALATLMRRTYSARARGDFGAGPLALRRLAGMLGRTPAADQVAAAVRLRRDAIADCIELRPEAVPTLRRLRLAGARIGLVSDCTDEVPGIVGQLPIAPLLHATAYSCDLRVTKPDPLLFLTAADRLGVHPLECLYVGDGGGRELFGACAVGMTAVRLAAPDLRYHLAHDPAPFWPGATVLSLADVPRLLARASLARRAAS